MKKILLFLTKHIPLKYRPLIGYPFMILSYFILYALVVLVLKISWLLVGRFIWEF